MKGSIVLRWAAAVVAGLGALPLAAQYARDAQPSGADFSQLVRIGPNGEAVEASGAQLRAMPMAAGCPVSLRAQHKADGTMVQTGEAHPQGVGQWLHLTLGESQGKQVAAAQITVYGFSDKARMTPTSGGGSDASRTLTVPFIATGQTAEADLWIPGMTAVETIEIKSVTFDDGAVWSFAGNAGCRIAPDPFMLIAAD